MSLARHTLHSGAALRIQRVRCCPHDGACGPVEYAERDTLALPLRGVFVKHLGPRERVVADSCHAVLFRKGEPYRVSHPVDGGDECLSIELSAEAASQLSFQRNSVALEPELIATRELLRHRLERGIATALDAEDSAFTLLSKVLDMEPPPAARSRRQAEMVEATRITLAAQPGENWSLGELAKRVHSSPFHLSRTFRALAGVSLHRYQLRARMSAALREVLDGSRELTAVAFDLGFSSHSHFTASFRRAFGAAPSALRKSKKLTAQ
ncbi:MAG TPA: helix-turn-helix transcriptional regulator [Burkholderiales bacterium]|nr:helix-turn-helix transcriptional regulator [Burkholderiales bacterium]